MLSTSQVVVRLRKMHPTSTSNHPSSSRNPVVGDHWSLSLISVQSCRAHQHQLRPKYEIQGLHMWSQEFGGKEMIGVQCWRPAERAAVTLLVCGPHKKAKSRRELRACGAEETPSGLYFVFQKIILFTAQSLNRSLGPPPSCVHSYATPLQFFYRLAKAS